MIIKLTNASKEFEGKPLLINTEHVVSIFETEIEEKKTTIVYSFSKDTWSVKETIEEIYNQINKD